MRSTLRPGNESFVGCAPLGQLLGGLLFDQFL